MKTKARVVSRAITEYHGQHPVVLDLLLQVLLYRVSRCKVSAPYISSVMEYKDNHFLVYHVEKATITMLSCI